MTEAKENHAEIMKAKPTSPIAAGVPAYRYALDPRDGYDVVLFEDVRMAVETLDVWRVNGRPNARLYALESFRVFDGGRWSNFRREDVPIKVHEAVARWSSPKE